MSKNLPTTTDFIVLGGGIIDTNTAYYLSKAGMSGVVLLERKPFLAP